MTEILLGITVAIFCIWGVSELIHILKQKLLTPEKMPQMRLIVYLDGDTPDLQLISIINEYSWKKKSDNVKIIGIYSGGSDTAIENCLKIADRHGITLCNMQKAEQLKLTDLL